MRTRTWPAATAALLVALLVSAACAAPGGGGQPGPAGAGPDVHDWDSVLAEARGQTLNWYLWGGSEGINRFVDETYGTALQERFGVTLNRVPIADTVDAVNQVLTEQAAGATDGAVDLVWINGENFTTLKSAGLLFDGWARRLPNARLVDWENPAVARDFGVDVGNLESPWSSAQFQLVYDSARLDASDLPRSYAALREWACAHRGRFTYIAPGPGAFQGTRFVKGALYELSGGPAAWQRFDPATWDRWSRDLRAYLEDLAPCLWRGGEDYPRDENELHSLFANGEVDFTITQAAVGPGALIADGLVPETAKAFVFHTNSIGDVNYLAIPTNASHKAAALVLANLVLEPEMQARQILPENGFGLGYAIDPARVTDPQARNALEKAADRLGAAAAPSADLARALVGDAAAPYQDLIETGWRRELLGGL
ncbi:MAG: ABC transporter substrate-binding protein [Acidimicrobiia bacterium]|nr:ABC transporter substrate-binding protein [Acidimicrobiia bacterium]